MTVTTTMAYPSAIHSSVLVFATSVESHEDVITLTPVLNAIAGKGKWNFALDDDDHILRIVSESVDPQEAIELLDDYGYACRELED